MSRLPPAVAVPIIRVQVPRRLHIPELRSGLLNFDPAQSHHARNVLRLAAGDEVEVFDDAGHVGAGIVEIGADESFAVRVAAVQEPQQSRFAWSVAAAVPKGERADWLVEKLSELGCAAYIPLIAQRSVVQPAGTAKRDRWIRLATESAKQSRRRGVMQIAEPIKLDALLDSFVQAQSPQLGWFLDFGDTAIPIRQMLMTPPASPRLLMLVGPEGGWTPGEVDRLLGAHLTAVSLTRTVLRIETAAIAAAACVATWG
jgi:16S rRNA (uracil1498-N3)-methyltransferase